MTPSIWKDKILFWFLIRLTRNFFPQLVRNVLFLFKILKVQKCRRNSVVQSKENFQNNFLLILKTSDFVNMRYHFLGLDTLFKYARNFDSTLQCRIWFYPANSVKLEESMKNLKMYKLLTLTLQIIVYCQFLRVKEARRDTRSRIILLIFDYLNFVIYYLSNLCT